MPGGTKDSSKTRVKPVFDYLWSQQQPWLRRLLALPTCGCPDARIAGGDLTPVEGYWEPTEKQLNPPFSLLSWMIRNAGSLRVPARDATSSDSLSQREGLLAGDPDAVEKALALLRSEGKPKAWYVFEGPTSPDVLLVTPDALVVIEGKRTELGPTTYTTWLEGRHQIWRHIDAAWEIGGRRAVYGFFIVEAGPDDEAGCVPPVWQDACQTCLSYHALETSFPHRSRAEAEAISRCFLGATTWRAVCREFGLDWATLPDVVGTGSSTRVSLDVVRSPLESQ